ncbi:MAG: class I SAM-dependent methyltransferase [Anaerolineae bacterium]
MGAHIGAPLQKRDIQLMSNIDFGLTADDYAKHRAGFPESFFERLAGMGIGTSGQRIVDLGTGTGTLARGFARRGCAVIGIDPAAAMLEQAKQLGEAEGVQVEYRVASAEQTGLGDASADVVTAGQCWHWFDGNAAAREVWRVLRPAGTAVIAHFDWIPLKGNMVEATEQLIVAHNPNWKNGGTTGLYPRWLGHLAENGFSDLQTFSYDVFVPYTPEAWRGRIRASAGVGASLPRIK